MRAIATTNVGDDGALREFPRAGAAESFCCRRDNSALVSRGFRARRCIVQWRSVLARSRFASTRRYREHTRQREWSGIACEDTRSRATNDCSASASHDFACAIGAPVEVGVNQLRMLVHFRHTAFMNVFVPQWQGAGERDLLAAGAAQVRDALAIAWTEIPGLTSAGAAREHGVVNHRALLANLRAFRALLADTRPEQLFLLGGDCSIELAPIGYFATRHRDLVVIWVDAHADANTPETS
ncbi:MAG: arginase family protein, partial [Polyangia bacterium]